MSRLAMKMRTRRLTSVLALGAWLLATPFSAFAESVELTLLHVNDVYEISPKQGKGGLAQLMTLLERERSRVSHHLTTFGGDLISPSVMSGLRHGAQMIDIFNALGVDAAVLGNHEFDFGPKVLSKRLAESNFAWLASNVLGANGKPFGGASSAILREMGGLKIGFFGLLTPETAQLSSPGAQVRFTAVEAAAKEAVATLESLGAELIIAVTHLGIAEDRALARNVAGIDVILGGHDHDPIAFYEGGKLILKAGHDAHYLAVADLRITREEKQGKSRVSILPQFRFISTAGVPAHPGVGKRVAGYEAEFAEALSVPVGKTEVMLDTRRAVVRTRESNFGNLVADAMRDTMGVDVGLTNGGGIRGDRTYPEGITLTRKDILTELPFGNVTVMMELLGADLRAALENGISRVEDAAGRFPQVSGMAFKFDPLRPSGSRILEVQVGGVPLDNARIYTVATNDYLANGGDGYAALRKGRLLIDASAGTLMASQVMNFIARRGSVAPRVEGRIVSK
jgi:2',3'-cyclic-nucleotide 2'-phosphodiesterase (5'-nucleotidase family)